MTEEIVDLRGTLSTLRRRSLTLLLVLGISLGCAVVYTIARPPSFIARSGVLLPPSPMDEYGKALRDMDTEVQIASSAEVLARAGNAVNPPIDAVTLRRKVRVLPVSTAVLEVQVSDRSARAAALLADAISSEYVAYSFRSTSDESDTTIRLLQDQAAKLDEQVRKLEEDIASNTSRFAGVPPDSGEALRITVLIDAMRTQQVDAARQLASVNGRIADARLTGELSRRGTRVLDSAVKPSNPARSRVLGNLSVGGLVGLIAGTLLALVQEQRDRRLRTRDEIARAAGAPVLISLPVPRGNSVTVYWKLSEKWAPAPVESLALRELFLRLGVAGHEPPANLVVVTLPGDNAASALAMELAAFAAATGLPTTFVVGSDHTALSRIRLACARSGGVTPSRENLQLRAGPTDVTVKDRKAAQVLVTVLAHGEGLEIPTWGRHTTATLAVSSGFATADALASVALVCLDAGQPLDGVLVANPDPSDRTTGRLVPPLSPLSDQPRGLTQGDLGLHAAKEFPQSPAKEVAAGEGTDLGAPGAAVREGTNGERPASAKKDGPERSAPSPSRERA